VAEYGTAEAIYNNPQHPYTQRLLASFPNLSQPADTLASIPGTPPRLTDLPSGCRFHPRCQVRVEACPRLVPPIREAEAAHYVACHLAQGPEAIFS
jgi:peptide/nickel transport system ATP-binding protein